MAHKTLIGGTAYNITGGKSLVSGTEYNISKGHTMVDGTGYDVAFEQGPYAMLYSDGDFVFQEDEEVINGKTLANKYTDFENIYYMAPNSTPWYAESKNIKSVYFADACSQQSLSYWFYNCRNLANFDYTNLNLNTISSFSHVFYGCQNLKSNPVCGPNVLSMSGAYYNCFNLTGSPV